MDIVDICLLPLNGGGTRGMSMLYILKDLLVRLAGLTGKRR
jgi:hypothetical protein